jgi:phosphoribosylglycinamide formyltransferase-1
VDERGHASRDAFERALEEAIDGHAPDVVALAGFMRVLGAECVRRYAGRMVNIHPSLLPAFPGLHTHRRALQDGVKLHGCTVHFVTPQVDHGPIIIQAAVPVRPGDTEATLAARVLKQEHRVYPLALRWFVEGRLVLENGLVRVKGDGASQSLLAEE